MRKVGNERRLWEMGEERGRWVMIGKVREVGGNIR